MEIFLTNCSQGSFWYLLEVLMRKEERNWLENWKITIFEASCVSCQSLSWIRSSWYLLNSIFFSFLHTSSIYTLSVRNFILQYLHLYFLVFQLSSDEFRCGFKDSSIFPGTSWEFHNSMWSWVCCWSWSTEVSIFFLKSCTKFHHVLTVNNT